MPPLSYSKLVRPETFPLLTEDFHGHKLDRKLLNLLQEFA